MEKNPIVYRSHSEVPQHRLQWDDIDAEIDRQFGDRITKKRKALGICNDHLKGKRYKQHGVGQGSRRRAAVSEFTRITLSDGTLAA